jgi:hypothetical protein
MYGSGASAPKDYRRWLAAKITPIIRRHGLERRPGSSVADGPSAMAEVRSSALGRAAGPTVPSLIDAALPPDVQPTLF